MGKLKSKAQRLKLRNLVTPNHRCPLNPQTLLWVCSFHRVTLFSWLPKSECLSTPSTGKSEQGMKALAAELAAGGRGMKNTVEPMVFGEQWYLLLSPTS